MPGIVVPAPTRHKLFSPQSTAEGIGGCAADRADRLAPSTDDAMMRFRITSAARAARRSIAISALALASPAQAGMLRLLR
jgi:hypothetical protein